MRKWMTTILVLLLTVSLLVSCAPAETETLKDELAKAQADITALQARNQELTGEIQKLNSSIETLLQQVDDLRALNQKLDSKIGNLNETIENFVILPELHKVAKSFSQTSGFPVTFLEVSYVTTVDSKNLDDIIDDIIDATAILEIDKGAFLGVSFLKDVTLSKEELNDYRVGLSNMIAVGDYIVEANWEMDDGTKFSTLAIVDKYGTPKFEPILYFAPGEVQVKEEWGWAPHSSTDYWWQKTWSQDTALGTNGVTVKIKLSIICDEETCKIISQSLTVDFTTGLFWEADSVKKETKYTAPSAGCPGGITECKKGEVKIAWASGFKKLKVKAKEYEIEVEGRLGCNGQKEFVMNVCCDGTYPGLPEQD